jgi:hypothetical protein
MTPQKHFEGAKKGDWKAVQEMTCDGRSIEMEVQ